ncbi:unnamed protein product [Clavelina lepadiformis]|uniref:UBX domain-containing protein 4 n=1 Tax=Clavelina lepadiformis TaxID=159417 RepID=A0ABP0GFN6_CLALP
MAWFNGSITEAIAESKSKSKLFVVYISGEDGLSKEMNQVWEKPDVQTLCKAECVCLHLDSKSDSCKQFSEIYPVIVIPVTYFIGKNGLPINVIGGLHAADDLQKEIKNVLKARSADKPVAPSDDLPSTSQQVTVLNDNMSTQSTSKPEQAAFSDEDDVVRVETTSVVEKEKSLEDTRDVLSTSTTPQDGSNNKAKEAARLQEKMNQRRIEKHKQSEELTRKQEIERRTLGKQMQSMKEKQEELKRKKEAEERKKEKLLEKEALERVREQIARDRAEKSLKFKKEQDARQAEMELKRLKRDADVSEEAQRVKREREKFSRIQYRLPDGSTVTRQYSRDATLRSCMDDLQAQPVCLPQSFQLGIIIPHRVFQTEDEKRSLADLELVPSASLSVRPKVSKVEKGGLDKLLAIFMFIIAFPFKLLASVWNFFTASNPPRNPNPVAQEQPDSSTTTSNSNESRLRRRDVGGKTTKREGNMHRLGDIGKDDDETATWNGNSTQQM